MPLAWAIWLYYHTILYICCTLADIKSKRVKKKHDAEKERRKKCQKRNKMHTNKWISARTKQHIYLCAVYFMGHFLTLSSLYMACVCVCLGVYSIGGDVHCSALSVSFSHSLNYVHSILLAMLLFVRVGFFHHRSQPGIVIIMNSVMCYVLHCKMSPRFRLFYILPFFYYSLAIEIWCCMFCFHRVLTFRRSLIFRNHFNDRMT